MVFTTHNFLCSKEEIQLWKQTVKKKKKRAQKEKNYKLRKQERIL